MCSRRVSSGPARIAAAALAAWLAACGNGAGGPEATDPGGARAALERGLELEARDELDLAAEAFREALALDPTLTEAHLVLGRTLETMCYVRVGRGGAAPTMVSNVMIGRDEALLDEAIEHIEKATELEPGNAEHAYYLGRALYLRGRDDEAIAKLEEAIALDPGHGQAWKRLGSVLYDYGSPERALECLGRARELMPTDGTIDFHVGNILQEEDPTAARDAYLRAIEVDRTSPWTYNGLALVLERLGDADGAAEARRSFELWQELETQLEDVASRARRRPDDLEAQVAAGELYFAVGEKQKALPYFRRGLELAPEEPFVHLYLGLILAGRDPVQGRAHLEKCLVLVPDAAQPKIELLRIGVRTNDPGLVGSTLERIDAEVDAWDDEDRLTLADLLLEADRRKLAARHYEAVLASQPHNQAAAAGLARASEGAPQ